MVQGDERYARLKHQSLFLHARGLLSAEMVELKRQLRLRERLSGRAPSNLGPLVVDRFQDALARAALKQLTATGLFDEWLENWEARNETASVSHEDRAVSATSVTESHPTAAAGAESSARTREQRAGSSVVCGTSSRSV
jgi:hypothetical protein